MQDQSLLQSIFLSTGILLALTTVMTLIVRAWYSRLRERTKDVETSVAKLQNEFKGAAQRTDLEKAKERICAEIKENRDVVGRKLDIMAEKSEVFGTELVALRVGFQASEAIHKECREQVRQIEPESGNP